MRRPMIIRVHPYRYPAKSLQRRHRGPSNRVHTLHLQDRLGRPSSMLFAILKIVFQTQYGVVGPAAFGGWAPIAWGGDICRFPADNRENRGPVGGSGPAI